MFHDDVIQVVQEKLRGGLNVLKDNPLQTGVVLATGLGVGSTIGAQSVIKAIGNKRKSKRSKAARGRKRSKRVSHKRGRIKHRVSAKGKLKRHKVGHRGTKQIHYTKNGQPYKLLASGKARFISKRGAKMSKRRKGGKY